MVAGSATREAGRLIAPERDTSHYLPCALILAGHQLLGQLLPTSHVSFQMIRAVSLIVVLSAVVLLTLARLERLRRPAPLPADLPKYVIASMALCLPHLNITSSTTLFAGSKPGHDMCALMLAPVSSTSKRPMFDR